MAGGAPRRGQDGGQNKGVKCNFGGVRNDGAGVCVAARGQHESCSCSCSRQIVGCGVVQRVAGCSAVPWVAKVKPIEEGSLKRVVGRVGQIKAVGGKEQWNGGADADSHAGQVHWYSVGYHIRQGNVNIHPPRERDSKSGEKAAAKYIAAAHSSPSHVRNARRAGHTRWREGQIVE